MQPGPVIPVRHLTIHLRKVAQDLTALLLKLILYQGFGSILIISSNGVKCFIDLGRNVDSCSSFDANFAWFTDNL